MADSAKSQLKMLDGLARALAKIRFNDGNSSQQLSARKAGLASKLQRVKAVRDKAEAARKYAQAARLGLEVRNRAAELKLRAERMAGELLASALLHGGNRRPTSRERNLNLADLGINSNQSSRWQREAAIPDELFERYVADAKRSAKEITVRGLLQMEQTGPNRPNGRPRSGDHSTSGGTSRGLLDSPDVGRNGAGRDWDSDRARDLIDVLTKHHCLLAAILKPICDGDRVALTPRDRKMAARLLGEIQRLIDDWNHRSESGSTLSPPRIVARAW